LNFINRWWGITKKPNLMKIHPVGAGFFNADIRNNGQIRQSQQSPVAILQMRLKHKGIVAFPWLQ
jgi:hypothetical protein